jgi:hypothetical protein
MFEFFKKQSVVAVLASFLLVVSVIAVFFNANDLVTYVRSIKALESLYDSKSDPVLNTETTLVIPEETLSELTLWMMEQPRCKNSKATSLSSAGKTVLAGIFDRILSREGGKRHVQEAFLFIVCKESKYISDAKSPADAHGISQMLLSTAQEEADKLGLGKLNVQDLYNVEISITLGYRHFKSLSDRYKGNIARASAAYNGGPGGKTVTNMQRGGGRGVHETDDYVASIFDMYEERRISRIANLVSINP